MAMILDAFVEVFVERLAVLVEEEIVMLIGVKDDLKDLKEQLEFLGKVLADAESKKIREKSIGDWLSRIRELMYDADDLLDDCRVVAAKHPSLASSPGGGGGGCLSFLSCFRSLPARHEIGVRIQNISSTLKNMSGDIPMLQLVANAASGGAPSMPRRLDTSSPVIVEGDIVGIDEDARGLVELLTGGGTRKSKCPIYAITGMPGIGKTTLAQKVFNDPQIKSHFEVMVWLCVSREYEYIDLLKEIARSITKKEDKESGRKTSSYGDAKSKAELETVVRDLVESKRFLLVLDDIWDPRVWELLRNPLNGGANDSKVLVTARSEEVSKGVQAVYTHRVRHLSEKECWRMLCKVVFGDVGDAGDREKLEGTGMEIVRKCKGLPLTIKAVGGLLKTRDRTVEAWNKVRFSRTWQLDNLPEDIKPGLLLSYEDLPSPIKQCFIYCSLFPEDFRFHYQSLVQMWIAEGFVRADDRCAMEETGGDYYRELVTRNLLQAVPDYYDGKGCRMHDLVRALALHVSQNEYIADDPHGMRCGSVKPRHLSIVKKESSTVPDITPQQQCLRTLLLSRNPLIRSIPAEYFENLRRLRVLDLTYTGIESLPESLGKLIHLRFLNVAYTKLKELPEPIRNLENLETLRANGLKYLRRLPEGVVELRKLRHLVVGAHDNQLASLPVGISKLEMLRTLDGFVANDGKESNMKELRNLSQLTHATLYKLERVASKAEAEEANLGDKTNLEFLRLSCTRRPKSQQFDEGEIKGIQDVFEGINPPETLGGIHIEAFFGRELPRCIRECSLRKLNWLRLHDCRFLKQLPPLGQLPELKVVQIWGLTAVSEIGPEFFRGAAAAGVGFPKLQEIYLMGMARLEKITVLDQGELPLLKKLHIIKCPRLMSLPGLQHATSLSQLVVENADSIRAIRKLETLSELKLSGNAKLKVVSDLPSLSIMTISNCPLLKDVDRVNELSYLLLSDDTNHKMEALPNWLEQTTSLKRLDVRGSADLVTRCCRGGLDWPKIQHVLHVEARSGDGSSYISYRKEPFSFQSNLTASNPTDLSSSTTRTASINHIADDEYGSGSFSSHFDI